MKSRFLFDKQNENVYNCIKVKHYALFFYVRIHANKFDQEEKSIMARPKKETVKAEEKAVVEVKAAEEKAEVKKPRAAKAAAKPEIKATIEFGGKNTTIESIVDSIKEAYKNEGNTDAIKTLDVYIQPENDVAYYVINGVEEGKSVNF